MNVLDSVVFVNGLQNQKEWKRMEKAKRESTCSNSTSQMSIRPSLVMTATLFSEVRQRAPEKTVQSLLILRGSEEQQRT